MFRKFCNIAVRNGDTVQLAGVSHGIDGPLSLGVATALWVIHMLISVEQKY